MYIDVYNYKLHTRLRSFITWQLVSTPSIGHHEAITQEQECIQKLNTMR